MTKKHNGRRKKEAKEVSYRGALMGVTFETDGKKNWKTNLMQGREV